MEPHRVGSHRKPASSRRTGLRWLALVVPLGLAACGEAPREPIRIGINAWPPFELLYLAQEKGFFAEEKVPVDLIDFSSYTGILRSYHQGNIDGFFATLNEVLIADNFQDLPAVVLIADYSFGGDALVVRRGIDTLGHLRGKRVAFEESALGSYMLERVLETAHLAPEDIRAINRLPEEGEGDFLKGAVDAVITYEPGLGKLLREPGVKALFTSRDIPGEIIDVLVVRRSTLRARDEDMRRIFRAWFKALAYLEAHPDESARQMAKRQGTTVEEFLAGLKGAHIPDLEENLRLMGSPDSPGPLLQTATRLGRFLERNGLAKTAAPGADLLHPEILNSL